MLVIAKIGCADMVWLPGSGTKSNYQMLKELPRTKVGGNIEYYTIVAEWQPPPTGIGPEAVQDLEDLHFRMGPEYLPEGSFLGRWLRGATVPMMVVEPQSLGQTEARPV